MILGIIIKRNNAVNKNKNMNFYDLVLKPLQASLLERGTSNAYCINETFYTYDRLAQEVCKIRQLLKNVSDKNVGLVANDDIFTYASIYALWLEGKAYVPLHPAQPIERCVDIINQVEMTAILDSSKETRYNNVKVICTSEDVTLKNCVLEEPKEADESDLAYILFTSGSTGRPKGVQIMRSNVAAFVEAFHSLGFEALPTDRCLQMFDLTFDMSVQSYLIPILGGACTYTVSYERIKYQAVFELLDDHRLTMASLVPSVIHYLRPYMDEINQPEMRYCFFAGEALPTDDTREWSKCLPNAQLWNLYGPTENTIYCTAYLFKRNEKNKETNGTLSIGKAMKGTDIIMIDDNNQIVPQGTKGEMCLAGKCLTKGYWKDEQKNKDAFFMLNGKRFYKSGDVCAFDNEGDIEYYGRKDSQIKIQGFRIELGEIEYVSRSFYNDKYAVVALPIFENNNCEINLVIETSQNESKEALIKHLKTLLPHYMIPANVYYLPKFPLNISNKIDRKEIIKIIKN